MLSTPMLMRELLKSSLQVFKHHLSSRFGVKSCPEQQVDVCVTSQSPFQSCDSHANEFKQKRIIGPELSVFRARTQEELQSTDVCQGWGPKGEAGQELEIDVIVQKKF